MALTIRHSKYIEVKKDRNTAYNLPNLFEEIVVRT